MQAESRRREMVDAVSGYLETPLGILEIRGNQEAVFSIDFVRNHGDHNDLPDCLSLAISQLREYFSGERKHFDLPLGLRGTDFQVQVWKGLCRIPFAETVSYGELARSVGRPKAFRAVGQANNNNPLPIVVPCHRVVGSNGSLTGYGSGIWRKQWLLEHERKMKGVSG